MDRELLEAVKEVLRSAARPLNVRDVVREVLLQRPVADRVAVLGVEDSYWEVVCAPFAETLASESEEFMSEAPGAWALQGSSHSEDAWCAASDSPSTELSEARRDRLVDLLAGLTP